MVLIMAVLSTELAVNLLQNVDSSEKKWNIIKHKGLLSHIKMGKEILSFGEIEMEKHIFYRYKSPIF